MLALLYTLTIFLSQCLLDIMVQCQNMKWDQLNFKQQRNFHHFVVQMKHATTLCVLCWPEFTVSICEYIEIDQCFYTTIYHL